MTTIANLIKEDKKNALSAIASTEKATSPTLEKPTVIENHKKIAKQLEAAAKYHLEAVTHFESGNDEMAAQSTTQAKEIVTLASELQKTGLTVKNLDIPAAG